jgi:hypothetical protein
MDQMAVTAEKNLVGLHSLDLSVSRHDWNIA